MNKFYLSEKSKDLELSYGIYQIFFTGGWYLKNLEELDIEIIDIDTNEKIQLKSKDIFGLRKQDYIGGQKAVLVFEFSLLKLSKLRISISNPEILVMKKVHPFLFLLNILFPKKIELNEIMVVIK